MLCFTLLDFLQYHWLRFWIKVILDYRLRLRVFRGLFWGVCCRLGRLGCGLFLEGRLGIMCTLACTAGCPASKCRIFNYACAGFVWIGGGRSREHLTFILVLLIVFSSLGLAHLFSISHSQYRYSWYATSQSISLMIIVPASTVQTVKKNKTIYIPNST